MAGAEIARKGVRIAVDFGKGALGGVIGGFGSTRWRGARTRATTAEAFALRITTLAPPGRLLWPTKQSGSVRWGDEAAVGFRLDVAAGLLQLDYTLRGTEVSESIALDRTRPPFGGLRWWFRCPRCARRCAKLYLPPGAERFACRLCQRLAYESQRECASKRFARRLEEVRLRRESG